MTPEIISQCEIGLCGIALADPTVIDRYELDMVRYTFTDTELGTAWKVLCQMRSEGAPMGDTKLVALKLRSAGVPVARLASLFSSFQPIPGYYVETLRNVATVQALRSLVVRFHGRLETADKPNELIDWMSAELAKVDVAKTEDEKTHIASLIQDVAAMSSEKGDPIRSVETGIPKLDYSIGGLRDGQLIILAARPSVGKSALAAQIAVSVAKQGVKALFVSLEMSSIETAARCVAHETGFSMTAMLGGELTKDQSQHVAGLAEAYKSIPLHVEDKSSVTLQKLVRMIRQHAMKERLGLVVVDYVGLIAGRDGQSEREIIEQASKQLKQVAREEKTPILLLSQLNRESEKEQAIKMPTLSQLRNSGSLEQDADVVLLLHRESRSSPKATLIVAKGRNVRVGKISLDYVGPKYEFLPSIESEYAGDFQ